MNDYSNSFNWVIIIIIVIITEVVVVVSLLKRKSLQDLEGYEMPWKQHSGL